MDLCKDNKRGRKKKEKIQNTKFPVEQSYEELLLEVERLRIENEYLINFTLRSGMAISSEEISDNVKGKRDKTKYVRKRELLQ